MVNFSLEFALVTGASYGIGFALLQPVCWKPGATIVFNDINQELVDKGVAAYAGIKESKAQVMFVTFNWWNGVNIMVLKLKSWGWWYLPVNNAGIIKRIPELKWLQLISVSGDRHWFMDLSSYQKQLLPSWSKKGHSGNYQYLLNDDDELGRETVSAYAAAKGSLKMLTKNFASEYGRI